MHGQWSYAVLFTILGRYMAQNCLIYCSRNDKLKVWIVTKAHIGKVLMREQLEQHCRHRWHTRLVVGLIPHTATTPLRLIGCTNICRYLRHNKVCKVTRTVATCASLELTIFKLGVVYSQRAYCRIVIGNTRIRVEGQRHIYRNTKALLLWQTRRATHKSINPLASAHIVIFIVVAAILKAIHRLIKACPLQPIARTLAVAWHSAGNRRIITTLLTQ